MNFSIIETGSGGNCYGIDDGISKLMIECGSNFKKIEKGFNYELNQLAGVIASHHHGDHCKAIPQLIKNTSLRYYLNHYTATKLKVTDNRKVKIFQKQYDFQYHPVNIGSWSVVAFDLPHMNSDLTQCPCLGFVCTSGSTRVLYMSDFMYSPKQVPGVTHLIISANYDMDLLRDNIDNGSIDQWQQSRILNSHASLDTVKDFIGSMDRSRLERIYLVHLSGRNADRERFREEIINITGVPVEAY